MEKKKCSCGNKVSTIGYSLAAIVAVVGTILCICGFSNAIWAVFAAFWIAMITYGYGVEKKRKEADELGARMGMIKLTPSTGDYLYQDYRTLERSYRRLGFQNITTINMHDIGRILTNKPGGVDSVTIGGKKVCVNEWFSPDEEVIIKYHGFKDEA